MGVFATRSPNRPNPIGLTRVKLLKVEQGADGTVLTVGGADLMSGTAIIDIKPYLPFADSAPNAEAGVYEANAGSLLEVELPEDIAPLFTEEQREALKEALSYDPRPGYRTDDTREYGFEYAGYDIRFNVKDNKVFVTNAFRKQ